MANIDIKNIIKIKNTVSDLMEKKSELEMQISDFKQGVKDIKIKKEKIKSMIAESKSEIRGNRILKRVEEKRNYKK